MLRLAANRRRYHYYVLAGVTAGLAAWTKNEGLLFVSVLLVAWAGVALGRHGWIGLRQMFLPLFCGALPGFALVGYQKLAWAGASDLFASATLPELLGRLQAFGRTVFILSSLARMIFSIEWLLPLVAVALALVVIARGRDGASTPPSETRIGWLTLFVVLLGYLTIYQITPYNLSWHITISLDRLLLHLWPGFLFSLLLADHGVRSLVRYLAK